MPDPIITTKGSLDAELQEDCKYAKKKLKFTKNWAWHSISLLGAFGLKMENGH